MTAARDPRAEAWELAARAVDRYYADPLAFTGTAFYLYHRAGELRFFTAEDVPGQGPLEDPNRYGWILADPRAERGSKARRILVAQTAERAMRLPILTPATPTGA